MKGSTNATRGSADVVQNTSGVSVLDVALQNSTDSQPGLMSAADHSTLTTLKTTVAGKQDKLTFDSTPTSGSSNPVTSGGVYSAINLIGESSNMNQREFSDLKSLLTAVTNGEVPPYAKAVLEGYIHTRQKFIIIIHYLSSTHVMPCSGTGSTTSDGAYFYYTGIDSKATLYYYGGSRSTQSYTVTKVIAYWTN